MAIFNSYVKLPEGIYCCSYIPLPTPDIPMAPFRLAIDVCRLRHAAQAPEASPSPMLGTHHQGHTRLPAGSSKTGLGSSERLNAGKDWKRLTGAQQGIFGNDPESLVRICNNHPSNPQQPIHSLLSTSKKMRK